MANKPIDPYKSGEAPSEFDGADEGMELVNDLAQATMRDMMSERMRKRVEYVKFRARQEAAKAMRSSSD